MPTSASFTGAVATPHTLATEAAVEAFRDGGSAIDAAIAAAAVLTVVYPHNVALGGDLIALVRTPDGSVTCVNSSGWAGAAADAAAMRATHGSALPTRGADTVTVPGGVRGWEALRRFGARLSWPRLMQPAQLAAAEGVPVAASLESHLAHPENADLYGGADFDRVFRPDGAVLRAGHILRQPTLASTFAALADGGAGEFYAGDLAARCVRYLRSRGSVLNVDDFADYEPEITDPIAVEFRGHTVLTSPPNTHGFVMLRALRAMVELDIESATGPGIGALMRVFHHGNRLRSTRLADPRMATVDADTLVHADLSAVTPVGSAAISARSVPRGDTVGIAAADTDGIAVSLIQSVYDAFGSGLIDPDTGVLFHNRGTSFSLHPEAPNVLAPRKRPVHTLMPVMTTQGGALRHVLATMGGQGQPQILTQVLLRMLDGASADGAVAAPRAVVGHQALGCTDDSVLVEADMESPAMTALAASELPVLEVPRHTEALGQTNVVTVDTDAQFHAATDPRADGAAVVAQFVRHRRADTGPRDS